MGANWADLRAIKGTESDNGESGGKKFVGVENGRIPKKI